MPTITREKALKNQALAPKGWSYDWKHYVMCGEHLLRRRLPLADGSVLEATVSWRENYVEHRNEYGCTWRTPAGTYRPELRVSRWIRSKYNPDMWESHGLGRGEILHQMAAPKRVYKELCKFAAEVTDEQILKLHDHGADLQIAM